MLSEFSPAVNTTTSPTEFTDSVDLAVAEEHHGDRDVFRSDGNYGVRLRFSGSVYFLSCAGVSCVAAVCFVTLRCFCYRPDVHAAAKRSDDDGNDVESQQDAATSTKRPVRVSPLPGQPAPTNVATASALDLPKTKKSPSSTSRKEAACGTSAGSRPTTTVTTVLDDGTERQSCVEKRTQSIFTSERASGRHQRRRATVAASPRPDVETPLATATPATGLDVGLVARNRRYLKPLRFRLKSIDVQPVSGGRPKLFWLLIVIVAWTSAIIGGPLSTVTSYACYPTGSRSFVSGAVVADAAAALACVVAARAKAGRGDMSTVIAMTCLGTIVLVYYMALVLFSLHTQQQQQLQARATEMPLFGSTAEMLAVSHLFTCLFVFTHGRIDVRHINNSTKLS